MAEQPEAADVPEEPQVPKAVCPLQTCDWTIPYPPSGDTNDPEWRAKLDAHTESHSKHDFLVTIGILQELLWRRDSEISDLQAALRGANFIMQAAGIVPKGPFEKAAEPQIEIPGGRLLIPDHVARELASDQPAQHQTGKAKHGDVVPGKGKLVGKKITDPMVLRDLEKGKKDGSK